MKNALKTEIWVLYFDGKKILKNEIWVIILKNEQKEIKLAALSLKDGKSQTIFTAIKEVLNEYDLWSSIKMIVTDTTNVNTGKKTGVVTLLQEHYRHLGFAVPQYVGCQHHVVDLILKHFMNEKFGAKTSFPNISYEFIEELLQNYDDLKRNFQQSNVRIKKTNLKWRDDMQYFYELGQAFRYYKDNGQFPMFDFKTLPNMSNARWNSRGILALLAFILIPKYTDSLLSTCDFITGCWMDIWFSDHKFNKNNFENFKITVENYKKTAECFERHFSRKESAVNSQHSNICAERAIKVVQDIQSQNPVILKQKYIFYNLYCDHFCIKCSLMPSNYTIFANLQRLKLYTI